MTAYIVINDTGDVIELKGSTIVDADEAVVSWMHNGIINSTGVASESQPMLPISTWIINWKAIRSVRVTGKHPYAEEPERTQGTIKGVLGRVAEAWVMNVMLGDDWVHHS
ncbi:MAG: hypothetical protein JWN95_1164 [Frankiales bacterium]|nr:hypothetical protein [Frankiales bacterium]